MRTPLAIAALALGGCLGNASKGRQMESLYDLGPLPKAWSYRSASGGADHAWYNESLLATIYTDSNCKERFHDAALGDLLTHLTNGMARGAPLREEALRLDNRAALLRVYDVEVDGVPLRMGAAVTIQAPCTYDMVYLAPRGRFDTGWGDFVSLVSGFETVPAAP